MSLIIAFNIRDGIVVGADRCTTHHSEGKTSHSFDSRKIVVLNNKVVILHYGDYFIDNNCNISVQEFLESCKDLINNCSDVTSLPLAILSKYKDAKYDSDNIFFVCGFDAKNVGFIYKITTKNNSVEQVYGNHNFGGTWAGITDIATPILKQAQCDRISLSDVSTLCSLAIEATGKSQLYCGIEITVGDKADIYVIHKNGNYGWFSGDAGFLAEKNSLNDLIFNEK